jgi:hypothetical protein
MKDIVAELVEQKRMANMARSISRTLSSASNSGADVHEIARTLSQMSNSSLRRSSYVDKCKNAKLPVHC